MMTKTIMIMMMMVAYECHIHMIYGSDVLNDNDCRCMNSGPCGTSLDGNKEVLSPSSNIILFLAVISRILIEIDHVIHHGQDVISHIQCPFPLTYESDP